jgi:glycosyltransferase involved in cell wall biosynthesis
MRIIHLIKDVHPIRMGIWTAAINTAPYLLKKHNVISEIWFPGSDYNQDFPSVQRVCLKDTSINHLKGQINIRNLDPHKDIIVTHSPWYHQSIWGRHFGKLGFKWVFVPHSSFSPWGLSQKRLKKKIYLAVVEKKRLSHADLIRALSRPEKNFLQNMFPHAKVVVMPTGINIDPANYQKKKTSDSKIFLFMGRLHFVKNIVPLVKGWLSSDIQNDKRYKLVIAGPDDGEFVKIQPLIRQSTNIEYIGPIYKEVKEEWLKKSTFFILPSTHEGFSVSLSEAAGKGLIPVFTEGCNFPELLQNNFAVKTGTTPESIKDSLKVCMNMSNDEIEKRSCNIRSFIQKNYSLELIAEQQFKLYCRLLNR